MPRNANSLSALAWALALALASSAQAQLVEDRPDGIKGVGVDEKPGAALPLGLEFQNEDGKTIRLGDLFAGDRPVLLSLNYSGCPMLCRVQLNGLVDGLKQMEWTTGDEYDVVSVSINPLETPTQAKLTKQKYVKEYGRAGGAVGWHFLVGDESNIRALADAVGFRYKYVEERQEYAHTAALMVCSQEGVVSRYLYGVLFDPQTVRLSLVEAAEGKVGSTIDQILLFCFHYDETSGRYGPVARRIMAAGGAVTIAVLGLALAPYWLRRHPATGPESAGGVLASPPAAPAVASGQR
ncbi:MAG: SCO family protein [Planctomycetota bacterium]